MDSIGALDQLVTLQAVTETSDGAGGMAEAWDDFAINARVWADVMPSRGGEGIQSGARNASGLYVFKIRNRDDVTERDRIVWNGEPYNITHVKRRGGREAFLSIEAERGVAQ